MPSQTITKTDGLVVVLDTFVFSSFVIFYRSVSFVLRLSFQHVWRVKYGMPPQAIAKMHDLVVVLIIVRCFAGCGA